MKIEAEIFRIAEKTPEQDEYVLLKGHNKNYWTPKVYNAYYNCWDTEDGDNYYCDADENDVWLRLPNTSICDIYAEKIK